MGYSGERYNVYKEIGQSLSVVNSGLTICEAGHLTARNVHRIYAIHFVLEGKGVLIDNDRTFEIGPGQGFLLIPGHVVSYKADDVEPWRYIYAGFCGIDDTNIVYYAGLDEENVVFSFDMTDEMLGNLSAMVRACSHTRTFGYEATGYFLLIMSRLIESHSLHAHVLQSAENYIRRAILYVKSHPLQEVNVTNMATFVGIDRTYLYKIFKECLGTTPQKYLTEYRLERAQYLLHNTDLPVGEIALETGFCDSSHFSRKFAAKYKMPPQRYRKKEIKET